MPTGMGNVADVALVPPHRGRCHLTGSEPMPVCMTNRLEAESERLVIQAGMGLSNAELHDMSGANVKSRRLL